MTLIQNSTLIQDDPKCLVDVKIIRSEGLRNLISDATNTQTAIVAEDAFSNEPEQKHIKDVLDRYALPYFYAPKRGMWERLSNAQRRRYSDNSELGRYRRLTSKELAAVFLAALGNPEAAKDKPRVVFEKVEGRPSPDYTRIFLAKNIAAQWLLPFEIFRWANMLTRAEATEEPDGERGRLGAYGRFRIVHLCYSFVAGATSQSPGECMNGKSSELLLETIEHWGPRLTLVALDALVDAFEDAQGRGESSGLREFFREKRHQKVIFERFDKVLEKERRSGEREGMPLEQRLGFPDLTTFKPKR
jgi:hypothetical protein